MTGEPEQLGELQTAHNDVHVFILWHPGLSHTPTFLAELERHFDLLHCEFVKWTEHSVAQNFERLYGERHAREKRKQLGDGPFLLAVVRDRHPDFGWRRTLSGSILWVNCRVFNTKNRLRSKITDARNTILVHSSVTTGEARAQLTLLVGAAEARELLSGRGTFDARGKIPLVERMMPGENGWKSLGEALEHLGAACNFVLLRKYVEESDAVHLPSSGGDLDLLVSAGCDAFSLLNAREYGSNRNPEWRLSIAGDFLKVDVRRVGDGDMDPRWQEKLLSNAMGINELHQWKLMYLAYHLVVQSRHPKIQHYVTLEDGMPDLLPSNFGSMNNWRKLRELGKIIEGFTEANGFVVTPVQRGQSLGTLHVGAARLSKRFWPRPVSVQTFIWFIYLACLDGRLLEGVIELGYRIFAKLPSPVRSNMIALKVALQAHGLRSTRSRVR